jgi:hypothetical protein
MSRCMILENQTLFCDGEFAQSIED